VKKTILLLSYCIASVLHLTAQNKSTFEGVVKYDISFEDSGLPPEAVAMLKGAEIVLFMKPDKQRFDANMIMQNTSSIMDNKKKTMVTLMDIMGQKYLIKMNEEDVKKEQESAPQTEIKYLDETKEIAGYKCKKAEVTIKNKGTEVMTMYVYYTEELPPTVMKPVYKGLKGCPLEYTLNTNGIKMKFTAKSVSKEAVPDTKFEIPVLIFSQP
jgi:GLPGLI family protein